MAADPSAVNVTTPPTEASATTNNDPFYSAPVDDSPQRPNRGSFAALMAAIRQVSEIYSDDCAHLSTHVWAISSIHVF